MFFIGMFAAHRERNSTRPKTSITLDKLNALSLANLKLNKLLRDSTGDGWDDLQLDRIAALQMRLDKLTIELATLKGRVDAITERTS
jgi:hypothetical protein